MRRPPAPFESQNAFRRNGSFLPEGYPNQFRVSTGKVKVVMDVGVLVLIALIGFLLSGGKIEVKGLFRRRLENRELTDGERKQLDK